VLGLAAGSGLAAGLALGAGLALPRQARACELQAANFRLIHPWSRATLPGAEQAALCMTFEDVTADDRLIGVETPVAAGAEPAGGDAAAAAGALDLPIPAGRSTVWHDEGVHVRLTGLRLPLQVGRDYPLTLYFAESGAVLARLSVDFDPTLRFAAPPGRFR
jgi:hypothetical protein